MSAERIQEAGWTAALLVSGALTGRLLVQVVTDVSGNPMAPWIIGRASGVAAYLLLTGLVLSGLLLAHPWRSRVRVPSQAVRIRLHATLAVATLAAVVLHIAVLATDEHAGVGVTGALVPMQASYRPIPTTFGDLALWLGVLAGSTASLAGRLPARTWWPVHKIAALTFVLVWLHGVTAGSDTRALRPVYLVSGGLVAAVAVLRYATRRPAEHKELAR